MIIIEDYTDAGSGTEPFTILVDNDGNQETMLPIINRVEPIDFPVKKQCKRRKFKSYLGKSYEAENR